jgi:F0F1-type ATP synthase assembly protein I
MHPPSRSLSPGKRLALLVGCVAIGAFVGFVGSSLTGSDLWYLAILLLMGIGWLFVANPSECEPPKSSNSHARSSGENAP